MSSTSRPICTMSTSRKRKTLIVICFAAALAGPVSGQQNTLRVDVRLVNVYATVIDSNGRYVNGLKKEDFRIEEDGKPQTLTHFSQSQDTPVSVGIIFDKSGS